VKVTIPLALITAEPTKREILASKDGKWPAKTVVDFNVLPHGGKATQYCKADYALADELRKYVGQWVSLECDIYANASRQPGRDGAYLSVTVTGVHAAVAAPAAA
jgi:hypothetical protein